MSLSPESLQLIAADPRWRTQRIARVDTPDGPLLIKGQRPARGPLRFKIMKWLSQLTRNPLLQPVPAHGGARAQNTEVQRLRQLAAAGLPVPAVLHQAPDYIALQFLPGESLQHGLTQTPDLALRLFEQGLQAIGHVHQQGQYLSQAFARNIMVSSGQLWFIDFEDDPLEVMDLPQAQTRDWLAYCCPPSGWRMRPKRRCCKVGTASLSNSMPTPKTVWCNRVTAWSGCATCPIKENPGVGISSLCKRWVIFLTAGEPI